MKTGAEIPQVEESKENEPLLVEFKDLAQAFGVETEYINGRKETCSVSLESLRVVLSALGVDKNVAEGSREENHPSEEEAWHSVLEPVLLHTPLSKNPLKFAVSLPVAQHAWEGVVLGIELEDEQNKKRNVLIRPSNCRVVSNKTIQGENFVRIEVGVPCRLPLGYYDFRLRIQLGALRIEAKSFLIVSPLRCYLPKSRSQGWGLGVQLYGVRSKENWGIGDFRDLERLVKKAGTEWKVSTVGLQPLHNLVPGLWSPYSPSSRLYWNPLYLHLETTPEFRTCSAISRKCGTKKFRALLDSLQKTSLVQYQTIADLKMKVTHELFKEFSRKHLRLRTPRGRAFLKFVSREAPYLKKFSTFQVLSNHFRTSIWQQWPSEFSHPNNEPVKRFQKRFFRQIQYYQYLQWLCDEQLNHLDKVAERSSMALGLYHDLPVGIHPHGADAWMFQDQLAAGVEVGAPPDSFNLKGQNWGLMAPNPQAHRKAGYQFLRTTLQKNMRHGGVLRIDHALGLFRMFLIPEGGTGQDGVYVRNHVDEVLAILALESVRHRVMIVGEDLGTVTPEIRQKLDSAGLLSYRVLYFEQDAQGNFRLPQQFPQQAVVAVTTHDLPTLKGYWVGRDIDMKKLANLYPQIEDVEKDWALRTRDLNRLWAALAGEGGYADDPMPPELSFEIMQRVYQYVAQSPSRLLIVQLEDLLGEVDTPNLPGAKESAYPSWRMRTSKWLSLWLEDPDMTRFAKAISRKRRKRRDPVPQGVC